MTQPIPNIAKWINHQTAQLIIMLCSVFLYFFAMGIYAAIIPHFIQQKVCSSDLQPELDTLCNNTDAVLKATDIITMRAILREATPVFTLLLAGSWRDTTGKNKPLMYSTLIGEIVGVSVILLAFLKWSISVSTASIVEAVLYGVFGGNKIFYVAATCAITFNSMDDQRTLRFMMYHTAGSVGTFLSNALSGYCLHLLGYMWFFIMVIGLFLLTLVLVAISQEAENRTKKDKTVTMLQKMKAITKSRQNNSVVWIMLISCVVINVCALAESNLYLYYLQLTFDFTVKEAGLYTGFRLMVCIVGSAILSPVFTKILKWSDFKIGILSALICFVAAGAMIFAKTIVHLIVFAVLDCLKLFAQNVPMSIVSKCVKSDEAGIFLSLRFIGGCLSPMLFYYMYDIIFSATSHTLPGAFFVASAIVTLLVFFSFCICSCIYTESTEISKDDFNINTDLEKHKSGEVSKITEIIEKSVEAA